MRNGKLLLVLAGIVLLLVACNQDKTAAAPPEQPKQSVEAVAPAQAEPLAPDLFETYADVASLPAADLDIEKTRVFGDRTLTLEDSIGNEVELLAYEYYLHKASAQFEKLADLVGEAEALQNATQNEAESFQQGQYITQYVLHALTALTADDLQDLSDASGQSIQKLLDAHAFTEFAIVEVDVSWKYNEQALKQGPQCPDGRYLRYVLFAKTKESPQFKLYDVFWDEFLTP